MEREHVLIIAIVNQGYASDAADAAKKAGATGGTIVLGHGVGAKEAERFFGITIQAEKELLLVVTQTVIRNQVMEAISQKIGMSSPARGIVFSLPVDDVLGMVSNISCEVDPNRDTKR